MVATYFGNFGDNNNNSGNFHNNGMGFNHGFNNSGSSSITCQFCNRPGHGARTCKTLANLQNNNFMGNGTGEGCIYCGKRNHPVEKCYYLFGFPNQQQNNNNKRIIL